jgi:hypothetical protein
MSKPFAALLSLAALAALLPLASTPARAASNPITINHCFVIQPRPMSRTAGGTQIVYVNNGPKTASRITFQVGYRNAESKYLRKVTDVGNFAPGAQIDHRFDLFSDVTYAGKATQSCAAISVRWSDGTAWFANQ